MANKDFQQLINDLNAGLVATVESTQEMIKCYNVASSEKKVLETAMGFLLSFDDSNFVNTVWDLRVRTH